jgi:hypothetical protein
MCKWFSANNLSLNLHETTVIILIKNSPQSPLNIGYNDKYIVEAVNTKFLGLQTDNHLHWEKQINYLIPNLSEECYTVRSMLHISNTDTLKSIYFSYFHSLMK